MLKDFKWKRGSDHIILNGNELIVECELLWACILPGDNNICLIFMFNEFTYKDKCNVIIVDKSGKFIHRLNVRDGFNYVQFVGCETTNNELYLLGADEYKYNVNLSDFSVLNKSYYR